MKYFLMVQKGEGGEFLYLHQQYLKQNNTVPHFNKNNRDQMCRYITYSNTYKPGKKQAEMQKMMEELNVATNITASIKLKLKFLLYQQGPWDLWQASD